MISGGGAPASGGAITINDTLGQPVIGVSSGSYATGSIVTLSAGYWPGASTQGGEGRIYLYLPLVLREH